MNITQALDRLRERMEGQSPEPRLCVPWAKRKCGGCGCTIVDDLYDQLHACDRWMKAHHERTVDLT